MPIPLHPSVALHLHIHVIFQHQPRPLQQVFSPSEFQDFCFAFEAFGSSNCGHPPQYASHPVVSLSLSLFFNLTHRLYTLIYLISIHLHSAPRGCHLRQQSSEECHLAGCLFLGWTHPLRTPREWLSGNSGNCSLSVLSVQSSPLSVCRPERGTL